MCVPSALRTAEERKAAEVAKCARKFPRARECRKFRRFCDRDAPRCARVLRCATQRSARPLSSQRARVNFRAHVNSVNFVNSINWRTQRNARPALRNFRNFPNPRNRFLATHFFQTKLHPNTVPLARNLHPQPKPEAEPRAQALLTLP